MYKQKIGISLSKSYPIPTEEVLPMLRSTGFDAVSPVWSPELAATVETARACGLQVQSLHAPFGKVVQMWSRDEEVCAPARQELLTAMEDCARCGIPVLVAHVWKGFDYSFEPEGLYFGNFDIVVDVAREKGVKIAFENTEGEEYLDALMAYYADDPTVGFCWDAGHELCYNYSRDLLTKYGDRLLMTHLNDNLGTSRFDGKTFWTDDLHLLPYDGIADWPYNIDRLRKARKQEYLNFELVIQSKPGRHENDAYGEMPLERFFAEAYKRACRIAYGYSR